MCCFVVEEKVVIYLLAGVFLKFFLFFGDHQRDHEATGRPLPLCEVACVKKVLNIVTLSKMERDCWRVFASYC